MKIHLISVHNINSLKGSFTVDFSKPPLLNCGLFAITGPTGAGKTTLLDALTLALFGDVARDAHVDSVMSYGCGECWAEVVFETSKGVFKARWARQKAHGKASGKLQNVKRELAEWPSGKIIAEKIGDVDKAVVEMLGLSRDQFLKSVLLAQGDFTAFLKADKNSRAELLERMTSTEEYRDLSTRAFAKFRNEENEEERLRQLSGSIQLLPEEMETAKRDDLAQSRKEVQECSRLRDQRIGDKNWFDLLDSLQESVAKAEGRFQNALAAKEKAGDFFEKWLAHQKVAPFEVQMAAVSDKQKELNTLEEIVRNGTRAIAELRDKKSETETAHVHAEKESMRAKSKLESKRPELQQAIAVQGALNAEQDQLQKLGKEFDARKVELFNSASRLADLRSDLEKTSATRSAIEEWLNENSSDKSLQLVVEECRRQLQFLTDLRKDASVSLNELRKQNEIKERSSERIQESGQAIDDCSRQSEKLNEEEQELMAVLSQWRLFVGDSRVQLESELIALDSDINQLRDQAASKDFFVQHHEALIEGKPCPLCGSESHPTVVENIDTLKDEIKVLKSELSSTQKRQKQFIAEREVAMKMEQLLADISPSDELKLDLTLNQIDEVVRNMKTWKEIPLKKEALSGRLQIQTAEKHAATNDFDRAQVEIARNQDDLDALTLKGQAILEGFQKQSVLLSEDYKQGKEAEFINQVEKRLSHYLEQEKQSEILTVKVESLKTRSESEESAMQRLQQELDRQQEGIASLTQKIKERTAVVLQSLESPFTSPEAFLQHLVSTESMALKGVNESAVLLNDLNTKLASVQTLQTSHELRLTTLIKEYGLLSEKLSQQLLAAGLPEDFQMARGALLPSQDRQRTEEMISGINREISVSEHRLAEQQGSLEQHKIQKRTDEPKEVIVEQLSRLNDQLRELNERIGALNTELNANAEAKARLSGIEGQIDVQHKQVLRWKALSNLIGSSSGDAFVRFAQTISLEQLLQFANEHLRRLSDRYQLRSDESKPEDLRLMVEDRHQAGWLRDTRTLSGGESFMVSLGLALGLAEMASRNTRIDSLFIDEGFGTLDEAALDDAISTLENLQTRGKTIGIISHVEQLKERIQTQVKVSKLGNGFSELAVDYA